MVRLIKFHTDLGLGKLSDLLPTFRNEVELRINDLFLITPDKYKILGWLKCGFRADWAAAMPKIISNPPNFLHSAAALAAARERLISEVSKGQLVGGRLDAEGCSGFFGPRFLRHPLWCRSKK